MPSPCTSWCFLLFFSVSLGDTKPQLTLAPLWQVMFFKWSLLCIRNYPCRPSLQCRRFWWSFECFAAISDSLQTERIGARMTECRRGWGRKNKTFPLPLSLPQFFFLSPTLRKLFTSPQLSNVFLFQDGGLNILYIHSPRKNPPALQATVSPTQNDRNKILDF